MTQDPEVLEQRVVYETDRSLWCLPGPERSKTFEGQDVAIRYARAHGYFLDQAKLLKEQVGWKDVDASEGTLVHAEHGPANSLQQVHLPRAFDDFLDSNKPTYAPRVFAGSENTTFKVGHVLSYPTDLCIDAPQPIADIFYMMQCIAPGMLQIVFTEDCNNLGVQKMIRLLPTTSWVEENKEALMQIFGSGGEASFSALLLASHFDVRVDTSDVPGDDEDDDDDDDYDYRDDFDDSDDDRVMNRFGMMQVKDFAACDKECGYCGACDY